MARIIREANSNPYKTFRSPFPRAYPDLASTGGFRKKYDEPTYLTFKLNFDYDNVKTDNTDFDKLPMPLFNTYDAPIEERNEYSTLQYLKDMDENIRASMMEKFIRDWNDLQDNYQWYFQSISGLDSILSVNPETGQRVPGEGRIEFTMLEAIDLRVTHLLDTYRKIAWDDTYQRWILPDIMRHFKLEIYVTEFRTFHIPEVNSQLLPLTLFKPSVLKMAEAFTPVYVIELERCEFDITSIRKIPDSLTVADAEMREFSFSIKVGNLRERYINPILNYYYYDVILNGFDRSYDYWEDNDFFEGEGNSSLAFPTDLDGTTNPKISSALSTFAKGNALAQSEHKTGEPFLESGTTNNIPNSIPAYARNNYNRFSNINPTDPATWAGNALTLGKAFVENLVEQQIDRAVTQKIPGLGISFNEGLAAIQSKNVFTLFGAARRAISENIEGTFPSQELEQNFVDTQLREFLQGIAQSEATSEDAEELQTAAQVALNDQGTWEKIRDYSKATDLLSEALGELNIQNLIENRNALKNQYLAQGAEVTIDGKISDPLVFEGAPSSATASGSVQGGKGQSADLGSTDGQLNPGSQIPASEQLGTNAGESLEQPDDGLGSNAGSQGPTALPSEQLGENAGQSLSQPEDGLGEDAGSPGKTAEPSEQLGTDAGGRGNTASPSEQLGENAGDRGTTVAPSEQLGENAGGKGATAIPSSNLGEDAQGGLSQGEGGLGENIEGRGLTVPKPGEATDGDPIENKPLPQPPPSKATNNDLE